MTRTHNHLARAFIAVGTWCAMALASAATVQVNIDTRSLGASTGYLDLQLSSSTTAPAVTAVLSGFSGFGLPDLVDSWGLSLSADAITMSNGVPNDALFAVNFGQTLSFTLWVDGAVDPLQVEVTRFVVSLLGAGYVPLGGADPLSGALLDLAWSAAADASGSGALVAAYRAPEVQLAAPAQPVPEPSSALLCLIGLVLLGRLRRRAR